MAGQIQAELRRIVQQQKTLKSHEHVVSGEVDVVVMVPMGSGDVVIVGINEILERPGVYLLRPERAAIGFRSNVSTVVVDDRVVRASQVVVHSKHDSLADVGFEHGSRPNSIESPDNGRGHARKNGHRCLTLVDFVVAGRDAIIEERHARQRAGIHLLLDGRKGQSEHEWRRGRGTVPVVLVVFVVVLLFVLTTVVFIQRPRKGARIQTRKVQKRPGSSVQTQLDQSTPVEHTFLLSDAKRSLTVRSEALDESSPAESPSGFQRGYRYHSRRGT